MSYMLRICLNGPDGLPVPNGEGHMNGIFPHNSLQNLYIPGQCISGKVVLELLQDEVVPQVVITLRGKFATVVNSGHGHYRNTHIYVHTMFTYEKILFEGGQRKLRATAYEWPFTFRFPTDFEMKDNPYEEVLTRSRTSGRYPLPPSFALKNGISSARIEYKLSVKVPRSWASDWKCDVMPDFTPVRMEFDPDSSPKVVKQQEKPQVQRWRYDENSTPRALTTKESMKQKFSRRASVVSIGSTQTQSMNFNVSIEAPTVIVARKAYPMFVRVESTRTEMAMPEFTLDKVLVHLGSETKVGVANLFGDHSDMPSEKIVVDSRADLGIQLPLNEMTKLDGVFKEAIYGPPTFTSVSIRRYYKLLITLKIKCLDDTYTLNFKWPQITILPAKMEEGIEEAAEMIRLEALTMSDNPPDFAEATHAAPATSPTFVEAPPVSADVPPPTYESRRSRQVGVSVPASVYVVARSFPAGTSLPSYEGRGHMLAATPVPSASTDATPPTYESGDYAGTEGNRLFGGT